MKPKVDPRTTKAIERLLHEIIEEDPRLRLSEDENGEPSAEADSQSPGESVNDVFQSHLNPNADQTG
jgi:hypothetical protein